MNFAFENILLISKKEKYFTASIKDVKIWLHILDFLEYGAIHVIGFKFKD